MVLEKPPYWMVAERLADDRTVPRLAVDERAARSFRFSQRALAERCRDQLNQVIGQYLRRLSLEAWLRGTAMALLVQLVDLAWLIWQRRVYRRLDHRLTVRNPGLRGQGLAVLSSLGSALLVRLSNAWFRALGQGREPLPGLYPEWSRPTGRIAVAMSIPNATVIGASIVNCSLKSRENNEPVVVATTVTIGYEKPWWQVHSLLLAAASNVAGINPEPEPFVLEISPNDFHISYELNAGIRDVNRYLETLSKLLGEIQDQFTAAQVEIFSPSYHAIRNGNHSTVPHQP